MPPTLIVGLGQLLFVSCTLSKASVQVTPQKSFASDSWSSSASKVRIYSSIYLRVSSCNSLKLDSIVFENQSYIYSHYILWVWLLFWKISALFLNSGLCHFSLLIFIHSSGESIECLHQASVCWRLFSYADVSFPSLTKQILFEETEITFGCYDQFYTCLGCVCQVFRASPAWNSRRFPERHFHRNQPDRATTISLIKDLSLVEVASRIDTGTSGDVWRRSIVLVTWRHPVGTWRQPVRGDIQWPRVGTRWWLGDTGIKCTHTTQKWSKILPSCCYAWLV
jgi:hypothetical protein